ncbi:hypothetical protein CVT24_000875 [Panaeolus cyanescens]|uniref:Uncharacterized protein n=1 Tax=Panaeolus cyanescens TaxID=181874 RepID=A0A409YCB9_9AGAR|nr:hypothetical protein CVT24_000875 [Panaeolus cyanescens]
MATASPPKHNSTRRLAPSPSPISPNLARSATARSAPSPRLSSINTPTARRSTHKSTPSSANSADVNEALTASLKQETDQKEQLLLQLQDKEQTINTYVKENIALSSSLSSAETRLNELYAEQSRWEMELAQRMDIAEKLREQVRELEKEKRDIQRRYNEQTATFEAERQAFYDNEQHLKSRIQTLNQARKRAEPPSVSANTDQDEDFIDDDSESKASVSESFSQKSSRQDLSDPDNEPAEMTSLKLELSTLSTSYASLQSTLILMQTQLVDLKRVNQELQEENESYMILLREKTLSGQFDLMRQVGGNSATSEDDATDDDGVSVEVASMRSLGRSTLDPVHEETNDMFEAGLPGNTSDSEAPHSSRSARHPGRKRTSSTQGGRGESLADLPITGPGLDLAAELGRAENKDILAGTLDEPQYSSRGKKNKRPSESKNTNSEGAQDTNLDINALRNEVKSLKDANKALSLYASKIIDRIIAQEGFEHVLAVDYEKEPQTPSTAVPKNAPPTLPIPQSQPAKSRPQSVNFGNSSSVGGSVASPSLASPSLSSPKPSQKANRRSLSFDWRGFSLFNAEKKPDPPSNLRPLTLKPGSTPVTGGRKLDNYEDEEDRKERERLHATMKLMGIQPPPSNSPLPSPMIGSMERSMSTQSESNAHLNGAKANRRFSFFGSRTTAEPDTPSTPVSSTPQGPQNLTTEALAEAEAENSLAALDARERELSDEIAKGSPGGFTEIAPRVNRRARRSIGGSSGSTVWSAGMSAHDD